MSVKWKTRVMLAVIAVCSSGVAGQASAITINGAQYHAIASGDLGNSLGIWKGERKGYTYDSYATRQTGGAAKISNLTLSDELAGATAAESLALMFMLNKKSFFGELTSSSIQLRGANNELLLNLTKSGYGAAFGTLAHGAAAEANIGAFYSVVGGSWLTDGLISGTLYGLVTYGFAYEYGRDFHLRDGVFKLYAPGVGGGNGGGNGGETAIPEPASFALLLTGLAGVSRFRKRKIEA